jgi:thioredoxin-related protein
MNKQLSNHERFRNAVKAVFDLYGIDNNSENTIHYKEIKKQKSCMHFELVGISTMPIYIKTAYAEDVRNNQAERYIGQLHDCFDEVIFIYGGDGWKQQKHLKVLSILKGFLGRDHVFSLADFKQWLSVNINKKTAKG